MAATLVFKLVVLAIGLTASDPATRAGFDETMAVSEALADLECESDGIRFRRSSWAFE